MSGWQPIETLWKRSDQTKPVLVFFPGWGVEKVAIEFTGFKTFVFGDRRVIGQRPDWLEAKCGPSSEATHWMHLPSPPETETAP